MNTWKLTLLLVPLVTSQRCNFQVFFPEGRGFPGQFASKGDLVSREFSDTASSSSFFLAFANCQKEFLINYIKEHSILMNVIFLIVIITRRERI